MNAEFVVNLIKANFGSILVFAMVVFAWWRGGFEQLSNAIVKVDTWYDRIRKQAEDHHVYELAKKGYNFANNEARKFADGTTTDIDNKIVDKATIALEWVMRATEKMGLSEVASEDVVKGYLADIHEAERKAKQLSGAVPFLKQPEETNS